MATNRTDGRTPTVASRRLRFRQDSQTQTAQHNRIDEILDDEPTQRRGSLHQQQSNSKTSTNQRDERRDVSPKTAFSTFRDFFKVEMTRSYVLDHDEERYTARREKIYGFMRIPRDLERFMVYGVMQCADSFLYIHTFLPVRFIIAVWMLVTRSLAFCFGFRRRTQRLLSPAEICDLLKGTIWIGCTALAICIDTNRVYHIIKSQSIIKLYLFYNMLEVADRLLSSFGQDTIDALFWTATEPKNAKREHLGLLPHILFTFVYCSLHSCLMIFQATTLNVALNSSNKGLLTIMISNNFVELKGSVFKKFDKNNLFQLTCSDVRERFHLSVLLFIVMIQTMKEFDWSLMHFFVLLPDCFSVAITEILIDWVKHAFIMRFNELPDNVYHEYTTSLAYDMTQTRQKHAFSDHSDLVARRMGFIPFPLSVVLIKAIYNAVDFNSVGCIFLCVLVYFFILGLRLCLTICSLGKACKLMREHQEERSNSSPSSMTNIPHIPSNSQQFNNNQRNSSTNAAVSHPTATRAATDLFAHSTPNNAPLSGVPRTLSHTAAHDSMYSSPSCASFTSTSLNVLSSAQQRSVELDVVKSLELGATAIFSNSDVDLDDVCLNEQVLNATPLHRDDVAEFIDEKLARSQPDLFHEQNLSEDQMERPHSIAKRTHKRSDSEPGLQNEAQK